MIEVKAYGFSVDSEELFYSLMTTNEIELVKSVKNRKEFLGIHPTPDGRLCVFLFLTPEARDEVFKDANDVGYMTAKIILNPVFVDEKYLR